MIPDAAYDQLADVLVREAERLEHDVHDEAAKVRAARKAASS